MWLRRLQNKLFPRVNDYVVLITIRVISNAKCMIRTRTQSNSNAGLSLARKAGKTQSYFSNQNGDMVAGARVGDVPRLETVHRALQNILKR